MNLRNHIDGAYPDLKFCEYNGGISIRYLVWANTKLRLMEKKMPVMKLHDINSLHWSDTI